MRHPTMKPTPDHESHDEHVADEIGERASASTAERAIGSD